MPKVTFGSRLKKLRIEQKISQETLVNRINDNSNVRLNKSLVSRYENGVNEPKYTVITLLAQYFGVTSDYLMGMSADRKGGGIIDINLRKIALCGDIRAGEAIYVDDNYDGEYEFTENRQVDFAMRVVGDSMIDARIRQGDIVYVKCQDDVNNGEIAIISIDNEASTIKRVFKEKNKLILHPENISMKDIVFVKEELNRVRIIGKVVEVKFKI